MRGREGGAVLQPKPVCVYRYVCVRDAPAPHVGWRALEKDGERCSEHEAAGGARGNFESWEGAAERKGEEVGLSLSLYFSLSLPPPLLSRCRRMAERAERTARLFMATILQIYELLRVESSRDASCASLKCIEEVSARWGGGGGERFARVTACRIYTTDVKWASFFRASRALRLTLKRRVCRHAFISGNGHADILTARRREREGAVDKEPCRTLKDSISRAWRDARGLNLWRA